MSTPANIIKCVGLVTHGSELSLPEGSLKRALNVNVDEDGVITPRRGFNYYKTPTGGVENSENIVKQLMEYKNTLIRHYQSKLEFEDVNGDFVEFNGDYLEVESGTRIKFKESNSNLYFTTNSGIKKISATSKTNLNQDSISDAGGVKAGYVEGKAIPSVGGFLPPQSKVAYRVIYGTKDINGTLIEGYPSARVVITNYSQDTYTREISSVTCIDEGLSDSLPDYLDSNSYNKGQEVQLGGYFYKAKKDLTAPIDTADDPTGQPVSNDAWEYFGLVRDGDHFIYENSTGKYCIFYNISGEASKPQTSATVGATFIEVKVTGLLTTSEIINTTANVVSGIIENTEIEVDIAIPSKLNFNTTEDGDIEGINIAKNRAGATISTRLKTQTDVEGSTSEGSFNSVEISAIIPEKIDTNYFIQLYRTSVIEATDGLSVLEIDPGDECSLVYEKSITQEDLDSPDRTIIIEDNASESFRASNQSLYTNEITGQGILQANEIPPVALDIELFRNSMFYANTRTRHTLNFDVVSVNDFVSNKTKIVVSGINGSRYYIFRGESESSEIFINSVPLAGDYIEFSSSSNERKYYIYFGSINDDPEIEGSISFQVPLTEYDTSNAYDPFSTYSVGEVVFYQNRRYKCAVATLAIGDGSEDPSGGSYGNSIWEYVDSHVNSLNNKIRDILDSIVDFEIKIGTAYNDDPENFEVTDVAFTDNGYYQRRLVYAKEFPNDPTIHPAGTLVVWPRVNVDDVTPANTTKGYLYRKLELPDGTPNSPVAPDFNDETSNIYWELIGLASGVEYDDTENYNVGDMVVFNGEIYKCIVNAGPANPPTDVLYWQVYDIGPEVSSNSDLIWDTIDELSPYIDTNSLTVNYIENGETDGINTTSASFIINNLTTGIGDATNSDFGGYVLLSKSSSIAQSIDVTSKSLVKIIAKDLKSEVSPYYLSTSEDLPGKILLENKDILDNIFYIAIESGYDEHIANDPYKVGDKVKYLGKDYSCLQDNTDATPLTANWEEIKLGEEFNSNLSSANSIQQFVSDTTYTTITINNHLLTDNDIVYVSIDLENNYNSLTDYVIGDKVSFNNLNYECILDSTGNDPSGDITSTTYWAYKGTPFYGLYTVKNSTTNTFQIEENINNGITFSPTNSTVYKPIIESDDAKFENRVYYSKTYQPEAVPSLNYIDVGPKDSPIRRILSLRDNLFVLKDDGVYVISGTSAPNFSVRLLDNTRILAADSAVVLNNQIYCLTEQGVATVTDSGVGIISRKVENLIDNIVSNVNNYKTKSFGVAYENDRCYLLFLPSKSTDKYCSVVYRYNMFERTWTEWSYEASCGMVASFDNIMYLGDSDINYVSKERKTGTRYDYAEKENNNTILSRGVSGNIIRISTSNGIEVSDVITQTQEVSINYLNRRLLRKLDLFDEGYTVGYFNGTSSATLTETSPVILETTYDHLIQDNELYNVTIKYVELYNLYDNLTNYIVGDFVSFNRNNYICIQDTLGNDPSGDVTNTDYWTYIPDDEITVHQQLTTTRINDNQFSINFDNENNKITYLSIDDFFEIKMSAKAGDNMLFKVQTLITYLNSRDSSITNTTLTNENLRESVELLVSELNNEISLSSTKDYTNPETVTFETFISSLDTIRNQATLRHERPFIEGTIRVYKHINKVIEWNPQHFGDPSSIKQIRHASIVFDQNNFYSARAKFYSDAAQAKKEVPFEGKGISYWSDQGFDSGNDYWGGVGNDIPFRNPVPSGKQKCRYLSVIFEHDNAREYFRILGISAVVRRISDRGWR